MTFVWPIMLAALVLVPLLVAMYVGMQGRRRRLIAAYGDLTLMQSGAGRRSDTRSAVRRHLPVAFSLAALCILIVALARPHTMVNLPVMQGTVVLAFDVSGSMAADDIKPTRMDAAKSAARAFVENQPDGVQVGVVTFSTAGFSAQAPTGDEGVVLAAIDRLKVQSGTSIATGIEAALKAIDLSAGRTGELGSDEPLSLSAPPSDAPTPTPAPVGSYTSAVIVLLTDGENTHDPDPLQAAQGAADKGIRIYTVGVATADGATLNLDGFSVRSRLDEETLQQISQLTGGTYFKAGADEALSAIYDALAPELIFKPQAIEVTALFAGAGLLILVFGGLLSLLWLGRMP